MADIGEWLRDKISRRSLLAGGLAAAGGTAISTSGALGQSQHAGHAGAVVTEAAPASAHLAAHGAMITVGDVDNERNGFDPSAMLTDWETGTVSELPDGRTLRTFEVTAEDKEIEIAPGIMFPAWTYNGRVPGPALRATEGERLKIVFRNYGSHPHSMHFHGIHAARMDGVPGAGLIGPGEEFVYEFDAKPFGCHLYHCHALPLKRHIHKGMYGAFVIDPDPARHPEHETVARSRQLGTPENAGWQRGLCRQHRRARLCEAADTPGAREARSHLSGERRRVRPDQLLPPPWQFLQLFRPGNDADTDAADRRPDHPMPGRARNS